MSLRALTLPIGEPGGRPGDRVLNRSAMLESLKYHTRNLLTLRPLAPPFSQQLCLILGCQRSGTTLLLSMLNAHPQIVSVDETEFKSPYPFPAAPRLIWSTLKDQCLCFKMLEHANKIDFIQQFYPQAKILWPIRDPRSTLSSMCNLTNAEGDWLDRCVVTELQRLRTFFPQELGTVDFQKYSKMEQGALYWHYKNQCVALFEAKGFSVLAFRYEDLLQDQTATLTRILTFLELPWSDDVLNFYRKNEGKVLAGGTRTDRPINLERAQPKTSALTPAEIQQVQALCRDGMVQYGYELV